MSDTQYLLQKIEELEANYEAMLDTFKDIRSLFRDITPLMKDDLERGEDIIYSAERLWLANIRVNLDNQHSYFADEYTMANTIFDLRTLVQEADL